MPLHIDIDPGGGKWKSLALNKLAQMKAFMQTARTPVLTRWFQAGAARIMVNSCLGMDRIRIFVASGGRLFLVTVSGNTITTYRVRTYSRDISLLDDQILSTPNGIVPIVNVAADGTSAIGFGLEAVSGTLYDAVLFTVDSQGMISTGLSFSNEDLLVPSVANGIRVTGTARSVRAEAPTNPFYSVRVALPLTGEPPALNPVELPADITALEDFTGAPLVDRPLATEDDMRVVSHAFASNPSLNIFTQAELVVMRLTGAAWSVSTIAQPGFVAGSADNNVFYAMAGGSGALSDDGTVEVTVTARRNDPAAGDDFMLFDGYAIDVVYGQGTVSFVHGSGGFATPEQGTTPTRIVGACMTNATGSGLLLNLEDDFYVINGGEQKLSDDISQPFPIGISDNCEIVAAIDGGGSDIVFWRLIDGVYVRVATYTGVFDQAWMNKETGSVFILGTTLSLSEDNTLVEQSHPIPEGNSPEVAVYRI